jgi:hypothetical protein
VVLRAVASFLLLNGSMVRLFEFVGVVLTLGVILLQRPSVYGGGGSLVVPNNEVAPDVYEVTRLGVGALGIVRPWAKPANGTRETSGFFAQLGGSFELDHSLHTVCGYECSSASGVGESHWGKHFAARLGLGYSFPIFEFRVGALAAIPDPHVSYAMPMLIPDVVVRIGPREIGWFEFGLGAYSASTNFRPGVYVGGALGTERQVQVSTHGGVHFVNGLCCGTVTMAGLAGELSVAHAFSNSLSGSIGVALFQAVSNSEQYFVGEASARLTFPFAL